MSVNERIPPSYFSDAEVAAAIDEEASNDESSQTPSLLSEKNCISGIGSLTLSRWASRSVDFGFDPYIGRFRGECPGFCVTGKKTWIGVRRLSIAQAPRRCRFLVRTPQIGADETIQRNIPSSLQISLDE